MVFADGYNMALRVNLDGLGILYISLVIAWTLILIPGIVCLLKNRRLPCLRIRNIPLSIGAVCCLHVYWVLCMIAYVMNGYFPCSTEFWIMSIYLPLGIALYHASNSQPLYIAGMQKKYAQVDSNPQDPKAASQRPGLLERLNFKAYSPANRTMLLIGIGMVLQFICALVVFLLSRKFHPDFGVTGEQVTMGECRRGWEWWPSIFWQFSWAWIYAPYLLWKVRGIKDVHGWRLQTILCSFAGMPGSPMWLLALYLPQMRGVSEYFVPPLWFSPCIVLMQGFVIFLPCIQVYKNRRLENETRQIIAEWEHKKKFGTSLSSSSTKVGSKSKFSMKSGKSTASTRSGEMYTMTTLEKTLRLNPKPLLLFAALKDFSGENISFLTQVDEWKANWVPPSPNRGSFTRKAEPETRDEKALRRQQFNLAVHIYSSFVSLRHSDFPINISSAHLKELEILFDEASVMINGDEDKNSATPFNDFWSAKSGDVERGIAQETGSDSGTLVGDANTYNILTSPEKKHYSQVQAFQLSDIRDTLPADVHVPEAFGPDAFDNSEQSIKELVLTNTWPKFVNAGYASSMQKVTFRERLDACKKGLGTCSFRMGRAWNQGLKKLEVSRVRSSVRQPGGRDV